MPWANLHSHRAPMVTDHDDATSSAQRHPSTLPASNAAGLRGQESGDFLTTHTVTFCLQQKHLALLEEVGDSYPLICLRLVQLPFMKKLHHAFLQVQVFFLSK